MKGLDTNVLIRYLVRDDPAQTALADRFIETDEINKFAEEGLSIMRMYTEPSCTPTRAAMLTGRHPVCLGIKEVKVALVGEGLAKEEVTIADYIKMNERYQRQTLEQLRSLAKQDDPFFLQYWPLWPLNFVHDGEQNLSQNGGFHAEKLQLIDGWLGEIFDEVERLGIAENTLVVLMADNGLMYHYEGTSGLTQLIYRGGKTNHLEGGVRVDAFARWPGVIEPGSAAGDIIHVTDLFTTFARVAQATKYVPRDRVIDGIDQTALLLNGEHTKVPLPI